MVKEAESKGEVQENYLKHILDYILLRTRLEYGYPEIFHYLYRCRCFGLKKHSESQLDRHHMLYQKGNHKLEKEMDVINIIKQIRQLRLMSRFLLTKEQKTLLKFQRKSVIESESSETDSDHHTHDTMRLLDSKKDLVKL